MNTEADSKNLGQEPDEATRGGGGFIIKERRVFVGRGGVIGGSISRIHELLEHLRGDPKHPSTTESEES